MISQKIQDAINDQINFEIYSSYIYFSMSSFFESKNLEGMAKWMRVQAQEELLHAVKFYNYVNERGGRALMKEIKGPKNEWSSPIEVFEDALAHERIVTERISNMVTLARAENDHLTDNFLQWFLAEQVEEEATADGIIQQLKLAGDQGAGLFMIDRELGARVLTVPAGITF